MRQLIHSPANADAGGRRPGIRPSLGLCLGLVMLVAGSAPALAQQSTVGGRVYDQGSGRPLSGAQVVVVGVQRGVLTDAAGHFRLPVTGSSVQLRVVMLGYREVTQAVRAGDQEVRIGLEQAAVALNEIVVTGTVGGTQKRALGNSVGQIKAATVVADAPIKNMQELINGRAAGVTVMQGTGMIGSGSRIRIRGYSTFSLSPDPLIYVDGIRVDNEANSGYAVQAFSSAVISRLNDFNPDQIESIEILKGPAAATLYGTEAARGVINIITKKGTPGATQYSFTVKQGANWFSNPQGRLPVNYWLNPTTNQVESLNLYKLNKDKGYDIFHTGQVRSYNASMSGGAEGIRYYVSTDVDRNSGAEESNFRNQFSGRANIQIMPSQKFDVTASTGYIASRTGLSCEAGCGGAMWGLVFSTPANLPVNKCALTNNAYGCGFNMGFTSWTPSAYYQEQMSQTVGRFTGSLTANYKPFKWMSHRLVVGSDVTDERNIDYVPYLTNDTARFFWGSNTANGYKDQYRRTLNFNTFDYSGTVNAQIRSNISSASSVGLQYYTKHIEYIESQGRNYAGPGLQTVNATSLHEYTSDDFLDNNTLGFFGQEMIGLSERLFLTGAVRVDNNSSFGKDIHWVTYPKASLSWVLNEEPMLRERMPSFINAFKLRVAYGESGQQPQAFTALRTFSPTTGPGDTPAITPNTLGNPSLKPERGQEWEAGFDAGLFNDRVALELTYYRTRTRDALLTRDVAPSSGFGGLGAQWSNAGAILNQGIESLLRLQLINGHRFGWDATVNIGTNTGKVEKLNGSDTVFISGDIAWKVGQQPRAFYRERIVSAQWDATAKKAINVMCDDGKGGSTPCFAANGTTVIAPRVFLGRTVPALQGSFGTGLRLPQNLRVNALLDFQTGFKKFDNNLRARCQAFSRCLENIYPERYDPKFIAAMKTNNTIKDWVIRDASFAKLREIAVNYTLPERYTRTFGGHSASVNVAARNLHTWTKWTGLDPENSFLSGTTQEQDNLPQLMSIVTSINLNF